MKKFKEFMYMFCWALAFQVINNDLGIIVDTKVWPKYIVAAGLGLTWAFYIEPQAGRRKLQQKKQESQ